VNCLDKGERVIENTQALLKLLATRFGENEDRHMGLRWEEVEKRLQAKPDKLKIISQMEETGGEPDVVGQDKETGEYLFCDCSVESPIGRRSLCYDREAWEMRKEHKPKSSATEMAKTMGIELLTEEEYRELQKIGEFDLKTSSWLKTPEEIRKLGGAIFADRRYNAVFVYHNGADSYYAARGFRGLVRV
jgi:hypothetical protein